MGAPAWHDASCGGGGLTPPFPPRAALPQAPPLPPALPARRQRCRWHGVAAALAAAASWTAMPLGSRSWHTGDDGGGGGGADSHGGGIHQAAGARRRGVGDCECGGGSSGRKVCSSSVAAAAPTVAHGGDGGGPTEGARTAGSSHRPLGGALPVLTACRPLPHQYCTVCPRPLVRGMPLRAFPFLVHIRTVLFICAWSLLLLLTASVRAPSSQDNHGSGHSYKRHPFTPSRYNHRRARAHHRRAPARRRSYSLDLARRPRGARGFHHRLQRRSA